MSLFARKPISDFSLSRARTRSGAYWAPAISSCWRSARSSAPASSRRSAPRRRARFGPTERSSAPRPGPALILSFVLLGVVCGLAALCYAELAAMIPQAGSAYAYSYATLGELVAWIIGWDLILEYAVGNIAVAVAWGGYFTSFMSGFGVSFPDWLTHGYRAVTLSADPACARCSTPRPRLGGIPILLNLPAFAIVMLVTWVLLLGVRESARANNIMVVVKLLVLGLFVVVGAMHIDTANYVPFAPNGWARHPPGRGHRLLCLHRLRRDLHGRRGDEESAAQPADWHPRRPWRSAR